MRQGRYPLIIHVRRLGRDRIRGWVLSSLIVILTATAWASTSENDATRSTRHVPTGLVLVGPSPQVEEQPLPPNLARAWSTALSVAADNNPQGLGYPWVDRAGGSVIVSIVDASGQRTADEWVRAGVVAKGPKPRYLGPPQVPVQLRTVKFSYAQLERIKDDATFLVAAGVPDALSIREIGRAHV